MKECPRKIEYFGEATRPCRRPAGHEGVHSPWPLACDENYTGPAHAVRKPDPTPEEIKAALEDVGRKLGEALAPLFEALGAFATDLAEKLKPLENKDDYTLRDDDK